MLLGDLTFLNYLGNWSRAHIARLTRKNMCHPVRFGFQINSKCILDTSMSCEIFWIHLCFLKTIFETYFE